MSLHGGSKSGRLFGLCSPWTEPSRMAGLGSCGNRGENIQDTENKSWKKNVDWRRHGIGMESVTLHLLGAKCV